MKKIKEIIFKLPGLSSSEPKQKRIAFTVYSLVLFLWIFALVILAINYNYSTGKSEEEIKSKNMILSIKDSSETKSQNNSIFLNSSDIITENKNSGLLVNTPSVKNNFSAAATLNSSPSNNINYSERDSKITENERQLLESIKFDNAIIANNLKPEDNNNYTAVTAKNTASSSSTHKPDFEEIKSSSLKEQSSEKYNSVQKSEKKKSVEKIDIKTSNENKIPSPAATAGSVSETLEKTNSLREKNYSETPGKTTTIKKNNTISEDKISFTKNEVTIDGNDIKIQSQKNKKKKSNAFQKENKTASKSENINQESSETKSKTQKSNDVKLNNESKANSKPQHSLRQSPKLEAFKTKDQIVPTDLKNKKKLLEEKDVNNENVLTSGMKQFYEKNDLNNIRKDDNTPSTKKKNSIPDGADYNLKNSKDNNNSIILKKYNNSDYIPNKEK